MFELTRLKLTGWYLLIIMTVSLLFSFFIYQSVNSEFRRFERIDEIVQQQEAYGIPIPRQILRSRVDPQMIAAARTHLITTLGLINLGILVAAGAAGYFLAGRTLRPVKKMVDDQNRFISDASHELRTPLTSLRSEIEVNLRNKKLTLSDSKKLLESNLEEVVSLQALSDSLLELAAYGKPMTSHTLELISLAECIELAIKKLNGIVARKHITIEKMITDEQVPGIQEQFVEVFVILLDNAIKYSQENATVTITTKRADGHVSIAIKDEGMGIAKEDILHIFDRFYRANKSRTKEKIPGYGLGLSIAKKIIESHNGTINVVSTVGVGTTFIVQFSLKLD